MKRSFSPAIIELLGKDRAYTLYYTVLAFKKQAFATSTELSIPLESVLAWLITSGCCQSIIVLDAKYISMSTPVKANIVAYSLKAPPV